MCTVKSLIKCAFKDKTPFAKACACAIVIGVADLVATGTDIYWLIGDMSIQTHPHHYPTMLGLILAELLMAASFIYLGVSLVMYANKRDEKMKRKRRLKEQNKLDNMYKIRHSEK